MLSGIKTGKKKKSSEKKKRKDPPTTSNSDAAAAAAGKDNNGRGKVATTTSTAKAKSSSGNNNEFIAQMLRQQLDAGQAPSSSKDAVVVVQDHPAVTAAAVASAAAAASTKDPESMTVQEMLAQEKASSGHGMMSQSEYEARNVLRLDKRRKLKASGENSDEEEERYTRHVASQDSQTKQKDRDNAARRYQHRQVAQYDQMNAITAKCWWWIDSPSFRNHLLISNGQYMTLMAAPANRSLYNYPKIRHFYLVPIPHAESLVNCDENTVWKEIRQYQASLNSMFGNGDDATSSSSSKKKKKKKKKQYKLLYFETVLPSSGSTSSSNFWQTRLEAVALPFQQWEESPFYYKQALEAQAQDWGTHQKLMKTTYDKPLTRTVPKNFHYFYVEYDSEQRKGFAQMIEGAGTQQFPSDFGIDTVAGMMEMDPVRFKRKQKPNVEMEKQSVQEFKTKFQQYDWTSSLATTR